MKWCYKFHDYTSPHLRSWSYLSLFAHFNFSNCSSLRTYNTRSRSWGKKAISCLNKEINNMTAKVSIGSLTVISNSFREDLPSYKKSQWWRNSINKLGNAHNILGQYQKSARFLSAILSYLLSNQRFVKGAGDTLNDLGITLSQSRVITAESGIEFPSTIYRNFSG
jgi:hypothetical protein